MVSRESRVVRSFPSPSVVAAAIANAVYRATGRRFRELPITIDQLL